MILDSILTVLSSLFSILLSPLEVVNMTVDLVSSIPVVANFITTVAYIFPWSNILPIIVISIIILNFKNGISLITAIWDLIPFVR